MHFSTPLQEATLIKRYMRFLADVRLDTGDIMTVHCPNSGAMLGIKEPGLRVAISKSTNPDRKLSHTLEMVHAQGVWIGANTMHPNRLVGEALEDGLIPELAHYTHKKSEVKYGKNSRIDWLLTGDHHKPCLLEVKNVHLKIGEGAFFPDSVTARGAKHMDELADAVERDHRCVIVYVVQRPDCAWFDLGHDFDPTYALKAKNAFTKGVEPIVLCYDVSPKSITFKGRLPVRF